MKIIELEIGLLKVSEYNPRKMTEQQADDLKESIERFGMVDPLIVNENRKRKNVLIGGHQRYRIAKMLNYKTVPVVYLNLTLDKEKELNLRLNKNVGEWDWDLLVNFGENELMDVGFDKDEIMQYFSLNEADDIDENDKSFTVLEVYPPEAPRLHEKAQMHCDDIDQYNKLKKAIVDGSITINDVILLI